MDKHDKVFAGMEKMATSEGKKLSIETSKNTHGQWIIVFTAGPAQVYCLLSSFIRSPQIVLEPFCEQLIKYMR